MKLKLSFERKENKMSDISKLGQLVISWNYGSMKGSIDKPDPIMIDIEDEEDYIGINFEQAKWLAEQLPSIVEKAERYKLYLELRDEFEEKTVSIQNIKENDFNERSYSKCAYIIENIFDYNECSFTGSTIKSPEHTRCSNFRKCDEKM